MSGERQLPGAGLYGFWTPRTDGWNTNMDANMLLASALIQCSVISRVTSLPGSPSDGDMYIVPSSAGSNVNKIAVRDNGAWTYIVPLEGWKAYCRDTDETAVYTGSAWISGTGANLQQSGSSNVTPPTSTSAYTMAGLAAAITPAKSGKLLVVVSGYITNGGSSTLAGIGIKHQISHGTGSAPANGAAVAGTQDGSVQQYTTINAITGGVGNVSVPFSTQAIITGLAVGTAYWVDIAQKAIGAVSTYQLTNVSVSIIEI